MNAKYANLQNLKTLRQFVAEYPAFTIGGLRNCLFYREQNGLVDSGAVIQIGRKLLINTECFMDWLLTQPQPKGVVNGK